jgi:phosphoribosylformimino-5-aminoimidazole carboxamide ribonucleotide (ProFAR) isomerase
VDLFPAVDIRGGRVTHVRAEGGAVPAPSVYGDDPVAAVAHLAALGARWVHLVDLDWAYRTGSNRDLVRTLLAAATIRVQVGGALDAEDVIGETLSWGAARVVIGCGAAAVAPELIGRLVRAYGADRIAVGVDTKDGRLAPRSGPVTDMPTPFFTRIIRDQGAHTVVYTDVSRDGTLAGPDLTGARGIALAGLHVVLSGGVGSLTDLQAVRNARLAGVIVGRALHEGRFTLTEALECATA